MRAEADDSTQKENTDSVESSYEATVQEQRREDELRQNFRRNERRRVRRARRGTRVQGGDQTRTPEIVSVYLTDYDYSGEEQDGESGASTHETGESVNGSDESRNDGISNSDPTPNAIGYDDNGGNYNNGGNYSSYPTAYPADQNVSDVEGSNEIIEVDGHFPLPEDALGRWSEPVWKSHPRMTYGRMISSACFCMFIALVSVIGLLIALLLQRADDNSGPFNVLQSISNAPSSATMSSKITNSTESPTYQRGTNSPSIEPSTNPSVGSTEALTSSWVQVGSDVDGERYRQFLGYPITFVDEDGDQFFAAGETTLWMYHWSSSNNEWERSVDLSSACTSGMLTPSMSRNGVYLIVGQPMTNGGEGSLQAFRKDGDVTWELHGPVVCGSPNYPGLGFSAVISNDGRTLLAGSIDNNYVRMISRDTSSVNSDGWTDIYYRGPCIKYGYALALSGDGRKLVVTAPVDCERSLTGGIQIVDLSNGWTLQEIRSPMYSTFDFFGHSLAMSDDGKRIMVGSLKDFAKFYELNDITSQYVQVGDDLRGSVDTFFGAAVAISGDGKWIALGAPKYSEGGIHRGKASVYKVGTKGLVPSGEFFGERWGDWFGCYVELSQHGTRLAVGSFYNDEKATDAGQVRIFESVKI